jgi:small subunit ribosomal protein S11
MGNLSKLMNGMQEERAAKFRSRARIYDPTMSSTGESLLITQKEISQLPHLFSVYATRHNTHINVCRPWDPDNNKEDAEKVRKLRDRSQQDPNIEGPEITGYDVLISVSAGNLGFRKSARKHYDSAFQTAAYVMGTMQERGWNKDIRKLEIHLRGFGAGREAVTKALLGSEGKFLRNKIVKVADNTRLKFGGTRSKKPRRLG